METYSRSDTNYNYDVLDVSWLKGTLYLDVVIFTDLYLYSYQHSSQSSGLLL